MHSYALHSRTIETFVAAELELITYEINVRKKLRRGFPTMMDYCLNEHILVKIIK